LRTLTISGKIGIPKLREIFNAIVDEIEFEKEYKSAEKSINLLAGSKFMFRTGDYVGVVLLIETNENSQRIEVVSLGGGKGIFNLKYGAGKSIENSILRNIETVANKMSLRFEEE
jgi:hypothetical protein